jgi:hypothetical protein
MLTLPVEADSAAANRPARILVIGRSKTVLSEVVAILRGKGFAAGATNEFDRALGLFDAGQLDLLVFGGMVPPDTKEHLREQISARNPAVSFVQGYAGIPGLIAAQVQAALGHGTAGPAASVTYDARSRSIGMSLDGPQDVTVIAWWATAFVPPEPESTSRVILDEELPAGLHTVAIPDEVPAQASFATVSIGPSARAFIVGPMPSGTTMARFPSPFKLIGSDPPTNATSPQARFQLVNVAHWDSKADLEAAQGSSTFQDRLRVARENPMVQSLRRSTHVSLETAHACQASQRPHADAHNAACMPGRPLLGGSRCAL